MRFRYYQSAGDHYLALIRNGKLAEVLNGWNLSSEAVPVSRVNPPGVPRG